MPASVLQELESQHHVVQFYDRDEEALAANAGAYLGDALRRGGAAVSIATSAHNAAFVEQMRRRGAEPDRAVRERRLVLLDSREALSRCLAAGEPSEDCFDAFVGELVRELQSRAEGNGLRAYGEMVGLQWNAGRQAAAERLEEFWNRLLAAHNFSLFCAYQIDVFGREFQAGVLDRVLCAHSHVVPAEADGALENAVERAMEEVLGPRAEEIRPLMKPKFRPAWAAVPTAQAAVLWLRNNLPGCADEILRRARLHRDTGAPPA